MKKEAVIFYSWQSDREETRNYVENSIKGVIKDITNTPGLDIPDRPTPRMDKDTQGEVGAVNIAKVIHEKIDKCDVFLADVTFVGELDGDKLVNQNVMYELGYALGKHSDSKIIMVSNTDFGNPSLLPFDINGRKVIPFSPTKDPNRKKFKEQLKGAVELHLGRVGSEQGEVLDTSLLEQLTMALEQEKPVRAKAEKFFERKYGEILLKYPGKYRGGTGDDLKTYEKKTFEAFQETKADIQQIYEVLEIAGEYKKVDVFIAAFQKLEILTRYYDPMPDDNGSRHGVSSEFAGLIVNEVTQMMFGILALNEMWFEMGSVARVEHDRPYSEAKPALDVIYKNPTYINQYYNALTNTDWMIPATKYFQERWEDNQAILKQLSAGGLLLYLVRDHYFGYAMPLYLLRGWEKYMPAYMYEFDSPTFISKLTSFANQKNEEKLAEGIMLRAEREIGNFTFEFDNFEHLFIKAGLQNIAELVTKSNVIEAT